MGQRPGTMAALMFTMRRSSSVASRAASRLAGAMLTRVVLARGRAGGEVAGPTSFSESIFVASPELGEATGLAWAPDGSNRLFVIRKGGQVRVIKDGVLLPTPFATVTPIYTG